MPTLCNPTPDVLCFGCCPPIRPPHYDPLDYIATLRREFADNRQRFCIQGPNQGPIVGFSCWALGFLDAAGRRIGCLLHPEQHQGRDLRNVTGYGDKCRRERCLAARVFAALTPLTQSFWLEPAVGLDSFRFSSARANPLFHLAYGRSWNICPGRLGNSVGPPPNPVATTHAVGSPSTAACSALPTATAADFRKTASDAG